MFGDQAATAAMIYRIAHHPDVLTLEGSSYRLENLCLDTPPSPEPSRHTGTTHGGLDLERRNGLFFVCRQHHVPHQLTHCACPDGETGHR